MVIWQSPGPSTCSSWGDLAAFGVAGGKGGHSFKVPKALQSGLKLLQDKVFDAGSLAKLSSYLFSSAVAAAFLLLLRVVNSPFARVLRLSARTRFAPKRLAAAPSSIAPSPPGVRRAGTLFALCLRYVGPDTRRISGR